MFYLYPHINFTLITYNYYHHIVVIICFLFCIIRDIKSVDLKRIVFPMKKVVLCNIGLTLLFSLHYIKHVIKSVLQLYPYMYFLQLYLSALYDCLFKCLFFCDVENKIIPTNMIQTI